MCVWRERDTVRIKMEREGKGEREEEEEYGSLYVLMRVRVHRVDMMRCKSTGIQRECL